MVIGQNVSDQESDHSEKFKKEKVTLLCLAILTCAPSQVLKVFKLVLVQSFQILLIMTEAPARIRKTDEVCSNIQEPYIAEVNYSQLFKI